MKTFIIIYSLYGKEDDGNKLKMMIMIIIIIIETILNGMNRLLVASCPTVYIDKLTLLFLVTY